MKRHRFVTVIVGLALASLAARSDAGQDRTPAQPASKLYGRLGGYDFIAKFVDTAFPRVASNPQLRRLFQGHSQDSQLRQRQLIVDALCQGTGGPCIYTGRPMKSVHTGLGISAADWTTFVGILASTLDELKVQRAEKNELLDLLERRFKGDVVDGQ
jgi:hemoglobin